MEKDIQQREIVVSKLDAEMTLLEKDLQSLNEVVSKLKEIHQRKQKLEDYYFNGDYLKDLDIEKQFKSTYGLLSEDGLDNLFYEINQKQLEILKYLVKNL